MYKHSTIALVRDNTYIHPLCVVVMCDTKMQDRKEMKVNSNIQLSYIYIIERVALYYAKVYRLLKH